MEYEKTLKSAETILTEIQVLAASVTAITVTGSSLNVTSSTELTSQEKAVIAEYNKYTMAGV